MADAKRCDICGKYFTCIGGYKVIKMGHVPKSGREKWIRYDACSECHKSVQDHMFKLGEQGGIDECQQQKEKECV